MRKAVFLDRDGTVNVEAGHITSLDKFQLYPFAAEAIRKLNQAGFLVVIVTNQGGVARGYFPEELIHEVHSRMRAELAAAGAFVDAIFYCPHHPEGEVSAFRLDCDCRKPATGMLLRAAAQFDLDPAHCFVVGDKYRDVELGCRAGARSVLVLTGFGEEEDRARPSWPCQPHYVAKDLAEAVDWILLQPEAAPV